MTDQDYHTSNESVLQGTQKQFYERRAQQGGGSIVPLPNSTEERHRDAPGSALPTTETEDDGHWPLIPPGEYHLAFVSNRKVRMWGRLVWFVRMQVVESDEYSGIVLPWPLNAIPDGKRPTPGWDIANAFAVATDRKPPKDLWRRRPRSFLDGCVFLARVCTITRTSRRVELPPAAHKSRVECLIKRIAGSPPYLRGIRR